MAVAITATIALTDAQAQRGGSHGGGFHSAPSSRAPSFRPQAQFHRPNNQQFNRYPQRNTQSAGSGRHPCAGCSSRPNNLNVQQQHHTPTPAFATKPVLSTQALRLGPGKPFTPKPGTGFKPMFPAVHVANKPWPILKGKKFIWLGGYKHFFIPVGLLGVALIGGSYWYPDGYVSIAGPLCTGVTPDGCLLEWRTVDFEDSGYATQCVQYCPQSGPPPAKVATLPPPPALALSGHCQLTIYENPDFRGLSAPTSDNQPVLSETGWKDEISSIQVESGTWDFFSDENFGGDSMRMAAGSYPMLVPEWNKRIGSFMCVEPAGSGA